MPADSATRIVRALTLAVLTGLALYFCFLMMAPFLSAFTWAFALAAVCSPLRKWLNARIPKLLATLLILAAIIIAVSLPGAIVARELLQESARAQQLLQRSIQGGGWQSAIEAHPWIADVLEWADDRLDVSQLGQQIAIVMSRSLAALLAHSVSVLSQAGVMLLALYFFLQDGQVILDAVRSLLPFSTEEIDQLFLHVSATVRATVWGRLLIGSIQGFLGGLIFALVGLPAAMFWGAVMILLSMLPIFGAFLVWIPASLFLFAQGDWIRGSIVIVWGLAVIHPVDNVLYPILVGGKLGMHPLVLFVAFVGGLVVFGPAGLILGPCLIAVAIALMEIWKARSTAAPLKKRADA